MLLSTDFGKTAIAIVGALFFSLASLAVAVSPAVQADLTAPAQYSQAGSDVANG
jgi:hypothetical protein